MVNNQTRSIKNNYTPEYVLLQGFYGILTSSLAGFATAYLAGNGITASMIGVILALSNVVVIFLQPMNAKLIENVKRINVINLTQILCIIGFIFLLFLLITDSQAQIVAYFVVPYIITLSFQALVNTIAGQITAKEIKLNFGIARAGSAGAFAAATPLIGLLIAQLSLDMVIYVALVGFSLTFLSLFLFPIDQINEMPGAEILNAVDNANGDIDVEKMAREKTGLDKQFKIFLLAVVFLFINQNYVNAFMLQIMQNVGGNESNLAIALSIGAVVELPIMIFYEQIDRKVGTERLLLISGVFFVIKAIATLLASSVIGIYWAQALQIGAFAVYITASVYYVNKKFPLHQLASGQAYAAAAFTGGSIIGTLTGGLLIDLFSVDVLLIVGIITSIIGAILMYYGVKPSK